jgi:hypothetical protein
MFSRWWIKGLKKSAVVDPCPGIGKYIWQLTISSPSPIAPA